MAMNKAEMWVAWTRDAVARYVVPDEVEDADELVDDMSDVVVKYADTMLDEYEERERDGAFGGTSESRAKTRKRKTERED